MSLHSSPVTKETERINILKLGRTSGYTSRLIKINQSRLKMRWVDNMKRMEPHMYPAVSESGLKR